MHKPFLIVGFALLITAVSCSKSDKKGCDGGVTTFQLNQPFLLCWGTTATQTGDNFSVHFARLAEESRCPTDVVCVTAGRVLVGLTFTHDGLSKTDTLTLNDPFGATYTDSTLFQGYKIKLQEVLPVPVSTVQTTEEDYKVKLLITN